ncbi:cell shape determination protein CcmA [Haloimpatiens sp. FM7330]|uniref:cell shape determination protein CcmA n=1 Tax=Haloimpatiens sp. FM7330 TaxID=3298610 RepID=UPI003639A76A
MENNETNLKITGAGESTGGKYNEVTISGAGEINGDMECNMFKVAGSGEVHGNLQSKIIKASGAFEVNGNIEGEDIDGKGAVDINGTLKCKNVNMAGAVDIDGDLYGDIIKISGALDIKKNCEAEILNLKGCFDIEGLLNAGQINIEMKRRCNVKEIGGEKIEIRRINESFVSRLFNLSSGRRGKLECEVIEGDDIYLEYTEAEVVRGNNIVLGPECEIQCVEYRDSFDAAQDSKVAKVKRI